MSLSSLFFMGVCWGMYKLGEFNAKRPGEVWELAKRGWMWISKQE